MIMPEYMFEINGSRINLVNVIKDKCNVTDRLGVVNISPAPFQAL